MNTQPFNPTPDATANINVASTTANVAVFSTGGYRQVRVMNDWHTAMAGMTIASRAGGFQILNGHIRTLKFYSKRLANANLQALTV